MPLELSKQGKKLARQLIEKGLQQEFRNGLKQFATILHNTIEKEDYLQETYRELYKSIKEFDKKIAFRYDRMSGSDYLHILAVQLAEGLINKEDISCFDEEVQNSILMYVHSFE